MGDDYATHWNERFAKVGFLFGEAPNAFLARQAARLTPGQRALAVADGEGRNGVWLAQQGLDVVSVDGSAVAQDKARRLAGQRGVRIQLELADIAGWAFGEAEYDVVAAIFIQFADPPLRTALFAGMQRTLKPGGLLLLEGYRPEQVGNGTGGPPTPETLYTEPMLREAFAGLEIVDLASYDAVIEEGSGHSGMSALIDLVARRPL